MGEGAPRTPIAEWARLLVCPACRGDLTPAGEALDCPACRLRYPVVDGVPHVVAERALPVPAGA